VFTVPYVVKWKIAGGEARSEELPGVTVPGDPFAGVVGIAPSHELMDEIARREQALADAGTPVADSLPETAIPAAARAGLRTIPPREIGGNLDIRQLVAGSRITLPVHVEGALVSVGDLHFAQGDGEVCGTGIEVAGAVTLRVGVRKPDRPLGLPSFETPERPSPRSFATVGIALDTPMDVDAAARVALLEMIDYLEARLGIARTAAYALCSVAVDLRISEVVDVPYPLVSALLPLDLLDDD
jgi:formamidase